MSAAPWLLTVVTKGQSLAITAHGADRAESGTAVDTVTRPFVTRVLGQSLL